jgi:DNA-binding LacI/PurR family transcriptional regulator
VKKIYQTIYDSLRQEIADGLYGEGEFLPTELELAARFETSRPTVAKALEILRRQGAIERRAGFGTVVLESELTRGKKIGLLIPRLGQTEIFEPICAAIEEEGRRHHWQVIRPTGTGTSRNAADTAELLCLKFIREKTAGVFFAPVEHVHDSEVFNQSILTRLKAAGIQVVLLDRDVVDWPDQTSYDLIGIDNIQAGFVIARHLLDQGCERFVFATRPEPAMTVQLRIMGCREALLQSGASTEALTVQEVPEDETAPCAEAIMQHLPDGLICANDATAAVLMRQLLDAEVLIPEQLKVAGFDDVKYASLLSVPLTTYHQPCEHIGRAAAAAMHLRLEEPDAAPHRTTLQGELIARGSTE